MNLTDQITVAVDKLKEMFGDQTPVQPNPPEGATVEELWKEIQLLRQDLDKLRKVRRGVKPKVEDAAKVLLEDPDLAEIPVAMVAELIRAVFKMYGLECKCSESSIRWYMSQRGLEWNIVRRRMPSIQVTPPLEEVKDE